MSPEKFRSFRETVASGAKSPKNYRKVLMTNNHKTKNERNEINELPCKDETGSDVVILDELNDGT